MKVLCMNGCDSSTLRSLWGGVYKKSDWLWGLVKGLQGWENWTQNSFSCICLQQKALELDRNIRRPQI